MLGNFILQLRSRPELIILLIMVMVVVMLIIPLPTYLVDFLIGLNLVVALLIFLGSFYITRILDFSTFPSILLISTIFRLAISISTSRLVLTNADAGEIIASFGNFVIADNLIAGFVIFFIVTIVQFIVITKGSERIAEVSARFSLDAMPGKQMSIDADLKAGVIDEQEVIRRRTDLEAESQLYGALDGAMKFIKGDAIAGIIIIFVNLLGGISVGVLQHGMAMSQALSVFTMLTIGDALVAQIPALLISISGGLIVTRVNNSENKNLGAKILQDMFSNKFILVITAVLAIAMGLLPGFPLLVFVLLAALLLAVFIKDNLAKKKAGDKSVENAVDMEHNTKKVEIDGEYIPETIPLIISVWKGYEKFFTEHNVTTLLKRNFFIEYGVRLPDVIIDYADHMEHGKFIIAINEINVETFDFYPGMFKVLMRGNELQAIDNNVECHETTQGKTYWIPESRNEMATQLGFYTRSAIDEFYSCASSLLVHNISEFFGIQETKILLDDLERKYPDLLKECYRNNTIQRITEVFQRLLQERISIRNMRLILEALVSWAPKEKDPIMLVEHVRGVLARYISNRFAYNGRIRALVLSNDYESIVRAGIRQTSGGTFVNINPVDNEEIISSIENCLRSHGATARDVVLMVSYDIRRFVKKIIESNYPEVEVLSYGDISSGIDVDIFGTIGNNGEILNGV
ncbi:EscV/YscV/HrcV family type III secretion system export apparatus protein [Pantoea agglomerans]|uniref:EscV/YscV/HrcV family type III secretion system export apparatus protein n=1 Tax=Enterobacter agglomerans TaxID=549 RepID=UPI0013B9B0C6|nr:EscV/YscV/HrcV family type III secretion system export apparatus protein [Pantoea agglomerans]NEG59859.1 EscV/YscV/HrcV family type III secretion system export apparatus protein [Pantoea agglomerans]NEG98828.1 EscV/YscV/HrcV family type III secretion system export apparatus protein [Pantoea agglomerans]NEH05188.1 EscV/YscV/HrcV family type III secretion system export apparatus protein [Pantoea agglomerans]NEH16177.1 EscV/YscV/HrcV family type III secretion system export apparatus protein [Pa